METNEVLNVEVGMDEMPSVDVGETAVVGNHIPNSLIIVGATAVALGLGYLAYRGGKMVRNLIVQKRMERLVKKEVEKTFKDEKKIIDFIEEDEEETE